MSELPPPGWYDDPTSPVFERWWDGQQWSEQTRRKMAEPPRTQPGQLSKIGDLLSDTFNLIGSRWEDLLMVAVVAGFLQALAAVLLMSPVAAAIEVGDLGDRLDIEGWGAVQTTQVVGFFFIMITITLVATLAHYRICWKAANEEESSWSAAFAFGSANLGRLIGWGIIGVIPVIGGFVLLVILLATAEGFGILLGIVGLIAMIWWGVVLGFIPVSIAALPAGTNPISSSLAIVKGRWWKLFGRIVLLSLMGGLVSGAVGAILGRFTGDSLFGFQLIDLGNGNVEITKDLDGPVGFFISQAVLFTSSIAFTVLQIAGVATIAYEVWRRADPEPEPDRGF
ncbi:MAG: DUF2510 domain-containing protein [bacterium]|nr:DUF2510 domain-containing protein [bacterium]